MIPLRSTVVAALIAACCLPLAGHASTPLQIPHVTGPLKIDGTMDEALWANALQISLPYETRPGENTPAIVSTTAFLMEDGARLYIGFEANDPQPDAIRAFLRDRDASYNDDFVGVVLDTFNDERRAFEFFVNPLGVQMDLTNDDVNKNEDDSWNAIWDSAGTIHEQGFTVEMAIPFSQIRFPRSGEEQLWGIDVLRFYPRDNRYRMSNNTLDRNVDCYLCQFSKVSGFAKAQPGKDLEVVPTLTAARSDSRDDPATDPLVNGDVDTDVGVSVRWGITADVTANLAINPDFSQVEADVAQLDVNNQFALFFPETRPFFLEGADYFATPVDAIFTRTVADPNVGAKITGKRGGNTFGVFAADDEVTNVLFPGALGSDSTTLEGANQVFVGRYSRSFGNASRVGGLISGRSGDGYHNYLASVDGRWRISDQDSIEFQVLTSRTEYPAGIAEEFEQPLGEFSGSALSLTYERNARDWFWYLSHQDFDKGFRADSGFVSRVDYDKQVAGVGHVWHGTPDTWWNRIQISGDWDITHDNAGALLERELEGYVSVQGPWQSELEVGYLTREQAWDGQLFAEDKVSVYGEIQPLGGLELELFMRIGDQIDFDNSRLADQLLIEPSVDWNINRNLLMRLNGALVTLDQKDGQNIFDARLADIRFTWQFNIRSFLRLTLQHQDVKRNPELYVDEVEARDKSIGSELLYSYKVNPQTVFFLGYSDNHVDDDSLDELTQTDRTLFMKIGYAWIPN